MNTIFSLSSVLKLLILCAPLSVLTGCGANTHEAAPAATVGVGPDMAPAKVQAEPPDSRSVATVFTPALGSGGNGVVMSELKSHDGRLLDPDAKYDVYDTTSRADLKTLQQNILASLDRERSVLLDSDGTPESREKAAEISREAVGGALPDASAVVIRKAPEDQGGGFMIIPLMTKAEVTAQIAQGEITKPEDAMNSVENFFFEPVQRQP